MCIPYHIKTVKYFSKMQSSTSYCIIFLFLGISSFKDEVLNPNNWHAGSILGSLLLCLVIRFVGPIQCLKEEHTPKNDNEVTDEFNEDSEDRNISTEVSDIDESGVHVIQIVRNENAASDVEDICTIKDMNDECVDKTLETEVELKEIYGTDRLGEQKKENTNGYFEDGKHDGLGRNEPQNISIDEDIPCDRKLETRRKFLQHEETYDISKDKSSLVKGTYCKNGPFTNGKVSMSDTYCISKAKSVSTKNEKDHLDTQTKGSYNPTMQIMQESRSYCRECSNFQMDLKESFGRMMHQQMTKIRDSLKYELDKKGKEIQSSLESLRRSTLAANLSKVGSITRNCHLSDIKSDDENNVHMSTHVKIDYDTLLDPTLDIDFEEYDSDTQVKQSHGNEEVQSMHALKLHIVSDLCLRDEGEHYFNTDARKLSLTEAGGISSLYPDTLSSFQGPRDNVSMESQSTVSDNYSDTDSVTRLIVFSEPYIVQDGVIDYEGNIRDDGTCSDDLSKYKNDTNLSANVDVCDFHDKDIDKKTNMSDHTPVHITAGMNDMVYSSPEPFETVFDLAEEPGFDTNQRDALEEDRDKLNEKEILNRSVDGPHIELYSEDIAKSFSQEVLKEFEISFERFKKLPISKTYLIEGDKVGMKNSGKDAISDANIVEKEVLEHENYWEKDEEAEQTKASINSIEKKSNEPFHSSGADDVLSSDELHNVEVQFDTMPDDKGSKEDPSVASLSKYQFSLCCIPYVGNEGTDFVDESLNLYIKKRRLPNPRIGKTQRLSRHWTVKHSEKEDRATGWRKPSRKIELNDDKIRYQRPLPSEMNTSFASMETISTPRPRRNKKVVRAYRHFIGMKKSMNLGTLNQSSHYSKQSPRRNKKVVRTYRHFIGMKKSMNLGTLNQSSHYRNERSALFGSTQKKPKFIKVDAHLEKVRQEIGNDQNEHRNYEKFQYHVENVDSGIFSSLMSVRNSILKGHDTYMRSLPSKGKERKKKFRKSHRELERLDSELNSFLRSLERTVARRVTNEGVVFGLEKYFESLNNGQTPSLQQQMTYEWLRLMSFSNYTGGGSPVHLAHNGFYHSLNNETRCFCCNTSYSNWTYSDNVQEVHRRISPNCPLVTDGIESNENVSIESGSRDSHLLQAPADLGSGSATGVGHGTHHSGYHAERPAVPTNHGGFAGLAAQKPCSGCQSSVTTAASAPRFSFNPPVTRPSPAGFRFPQTSNQLPTGIPSQAGQSAAPVTTTRAPGFSFGAPLNAPAPAGFTFGQSTSQQVGSSDISSQLGALTLQQSIGAQQPSDEPISGNPVIAPTQPLQIARQTGEGQLSISAQQPPETSDLPQNAARNQRTSESSGSASPAQQNESADTIEIAQLKHPRYRTMDVRMSSFRSWPNYLNQTPRQMAYAGFFHPGVADFARCFCCGGGLRNWEADDDPMVEHARWYPRCEYINKLKGTHFVQAVLRRHREHMAERQREQEVPQNTFLTPDPMTTSIAANLLDMGFTQERAREAILAVRQLRGRSEVSIEEVTTWMLDDGNTRHQEPAERGTTVNPRDTVATAPPQQARPRTPASSGSGSFESAVSSRHDSDGHSSVEDRGQGSAEEPQGATGGAKKEAKLPKAKSGKDDSSSDDKSGKEDKSDDDKTRKDKGKSSKEDYSSDDKSKEDKDPAKKKPKSKKDKKKKPRKGQSGVSGGASADIDTKSLKEENKQLKQMQVCKICMDKYVSITFLPCGHLVCCEDCAKNMRKCPICRKRIKGQVRTFMS